MKRAALLLTILAGAVFTACGGDDDDVELTTAPAATATTASATTAPGETPATQPAATVATTTAPATPDDANTIDLDEDKDDAFDAFETTIKQLVDGQFGRVYPRIHPAQRALFTLEQYEKCAQGAANYNEVEVDLKEAYLEEDSLIPGTDIRQDSIALTVNMKLDELENADTFHEFKVDGEWYFVVADAQATIDGTC